MSSGTLFASVPAGAGPPETEGNQPGPAAPAAAGLPLESPFSFSVRTRMLDRGAQVSLSGELDAYSAPVLERELLAAEQQVEGPILIDLTQLQFVDCCGLAALQEAKRRASQRCRRLVLVNAQPAIRRFLHLAEREGLLTPAENAPPFVLASLR